nr:hypothetical protein [Tanacetum cinerariifolium]
MQNPKDISNPTIALDMALELMAKAFQLNNTTPTNNNQRISSNPCYSQISQLGTNIDQYRHMLMVDDNVGNQFRENVVQIANQHGNGNVVAARVKGNSNGINGNPIRCYNCQGEDHYASNCTIKPRKQDNELSAVPGIANQHGNGNVVAAQAEGACEETKRDNANCTSETNLQQASMSSTKSDKALVYDTDGSAEVHLSKNCHDNDIFNMFTQEEQYTKLLEPIPGPHQVPQNDSNVISKVFSVEQEATKFVRDFKSLAKEADESLSKHKALELEIEHLLRAVVSQDIMSIVQNNSVVNSSNLKTELERTKEHFENYIIKKENEYAKLWNDWYKKCEECKYDKISYDKAYNDMQQKIEWLQAQLGDLKGKRIFRMNSFKASRVDNFVPNKHVKAIVRTKPITISQPHVITKNDVNSKTNGYSPKDVKNTTKTRRPLPMNKAKNDKVPSKSKSSRFSNNLEKLEENHRNLQSSSNQKHMSSECNNIKLDIRNAKSKIMYAMCLETEECRVQRLASPKPSTPRSCLRWSPIGRMFDLKRRIIATSESVGQSDCSKGDNACTSNPQELISKRFPNSTFSMTGGQNWFDTMLIPLLSEYKPKDKEDHRENECDT